MALRGIGDTEQAITFSTMVLCGCDPWMVRPLCVTQAGLALIHLHARDLEQAAALGRDALRTAASLTTTPPDGQLPRRCHRATAGLHRTAHDDRLASPIVVSCGNTAARSISLSSHPSASIPLSQREIRSIASARPNSAGQRSADNPWFVLSLE
ncbi:MAG: hypothetical protein ACRDRE_16750 [Pseudonocardiaceae bacterium]